jgi:hypothetical protein
MFSIGLLMCDATLRKIYYLISHISYLKLQYRVNIRFAHDQVFFTIKGNFCTCIFAI